MIVGNWMRRDPVTVGGDALVSEAERVLTERNVHALPVVEAGRLRGLLTRASCARAAGFVARSQSPDEFAFFAHRLAVRDIMVRNPATVTVDDTMEHCLLKGQELGVGQFPVLDGERVVGLVSAHEIFQLTAQFLGAREKWSGITLAPVALGPGTLGRIAATVEAAAATLCALYPIGQDDASDLAGATGKRVIVRCVTPDVGAVARALEAAGYRVLEQAAQVQSR